jgi:hypothetical protein
MHHTFHHKLNKSDVNGKSKPRFLQYTFYFHQETIVVLYHLLHNCYILAFTSNNANGVLEYYQSDTFMSTMWHH